LKGSCRLIKGGTRGHHIINQQHGPIGDAVTLVLRNGKRACQITLSLASAQSGLCWASLWPRQCFRGKDASFILLAQQARQLGRLVEPPVKISFGTKRDRHKGYDQNKTADIMGIAWANADQAMRYNAVGIGWRVWFALPVS
jgi:hypothetical protein